MDLIKKSPRRSMRSPLLLGLALAFAVSATAQAAQPAPEGAMTPELQQQLKAAQERLEAAAREVAELSAKAGQGGPRIQMRIQRMGGPEQREIEVNTMGPPGAAAGPAAPMGPMGSAHGMGQMGGMDHMGGMGGMGGPMRLMAAMHGGLRLAPMSPRLAGYFGAKAGVLVVKAGNPDFKLQDGDVITAIGGRTPATPMQAMRIFHSYEPGEKVPLQLLRDRKALTVEITVPPRMEARTEMRRFELRRGEGAPPAPPAAPPAPPHQH